jgi:hypothetical protein
MVFYRVQIKDSKDQNAVINVRFQHGLVLPFSGNWFQEGAPGRIHAAKSEEDNIFKVATGQGNLNADFFARSPDDNQLYPVLTLESVTKAIPTVWLPKGTGTLLQGTREILKSGAISWYLL